MQNTQRIAAATAVALVLMGGAWYFNRPSSTTFSPSATSTTPTTTTVSNTPGATPATTPPSPAQGTSGGATTPPSTTPAYATNTLPISSKDTLVSWSFKGSYSDNGTFQQKAESQIASLKNKINENDPTVQEIYISIGQQYKLLGDGKNAYNYYLRALNSKQRYEQEDGLAWVNLGDLMQILHAYYTAATAYANAVKAIPGEPSFHVARISFLLSYLPKETALINAAFADAEKYVPNDASVAQLKAQYQKTLTQ